MAVIIEGISVVINGKDLVGEKFKDNDEFKSIVPNETLVADGELMAVAFMDPNDVQKFITVLEEYNLTFLKDGKAKDIAVVDQRHGFTVPCDWAQYGHGSFDNGQTVAICRHCNSLVTEVYTPTGWDYENSLSSKSFFVPTGNKDDKVVFLRREGNIDVYFNYNTGKETYVGRT